MARRCLLPERQTMRPHALIYHWTVFHRPGSSRGTLRCWGHRSRLQWMATHRQYHTDWWTHPRLPSRHDPWAISPPGGLISLTESLRRDDVKGVGAAATSAGAAVVATAASACCIPVIAPLIVGVLGASGAAWAAGLQPYSPAILGFSGLLLGYGFWVVYRQRQMEEGTSCPIGRPKGVQVVLWLAAALWTLAMILNLVPQIARATS